MAIVSCVWRQLHVFLIGSLSVSFIIGHSFPCLASASCILIGSLSVIYFIEYVIC